MVVPGLGAPGEESPAPGVPAKRRLGHWRAWGAAAAACLVVILVAAAVAYPAYRSAFARASGWKVDATTTDLPAPQLLAAPPRQLASGWNGVFLQPPDDDAVSQRFLVWKGYLVVAAPDGVTVRNALDGRERWHYSDSFATADLSAATPVGAGDGFVADVLTPNGSTHSRVMLFDARTGRLLWTASAPRHEYHPLVGRSQVILVPAAGTPGSAIIALDRQTGRQAWALPVGDCAPQSDGIVLAGVLAGRVLAETNCGGITRLRGIDLASGHLVWANRYQGASPDLSTPLQAGELPGRFILLDAANRDGTERIALVDGVTGRRAGGGRLPLDAGFLVAASDGWCVIAVHHASCYDRQGRARWRRPLPPSDPDFDDDAQATTATVTGDDLAVLVDTDDHGLSFAAFDVLSGRWITSPAALPGVPSASDIVSYGRAGLILMDGSQRLWAYHSPGPDGPEPAAIWWPGFTHAPGIPLGRGPALPEGRGG